MTYCVFKVFSEISTPTDKVRQRLGVGLAGEGNPVGLELHLEFAGILDDAVMHNSDAARLVHMRVRVGIRRLAVGCPTGVANSYVRSESFRKDRLKLAELSLLLEGRHCALRLHDRNAR